MRLRDLLSGPPPPAAPAPPKGPSARARLVERLENEVAFLRDLLEKERAAAELREAELRAQLVAMANQSALAMASYYGPARKTNGGEETFAGQGVRRLVVPTATPRTGGASEDDGAAADRPWANSYFGDDHLDLGKEFAADVPAAGPTDDLDEEALAEATIERAAKEREAARLRPAAAQEG